MKLLFLLMVTALFTNTSYATPAEDFLKAKMEVLNAREQSALLKVAQRLNLSQSEIENATKRTLEHETLSRFGYIQSQLGICEIDLKFSLEENTKRIRCINNLTVTTYFP